MVLFTGCYVNISIFRVNIIYYFYKSGHWRAINRAEILSEPETFLDLPFFRSFFFIFVRAKYIFKNPPFVAALFFYMSRVQRGTLAKRARCIEL